MQEPSYLGETVLVSIWYGMILTQIITQVFKDSLTFIFVTKYLYLTRITILMSTSTRFFDAIIDVDYYYHAFDYVPAQHWLRTCFDRCTREFSSHSFWSE